MTTRSVKTFYDADKALKELRAYHADITVDLMRQAGMFAYYSTLLAQAETQYERISHHIEVMEARKDAEIRLQMDAAGEKATESKIKAKLTTDPDIRDLRRLAIDAKEQVALLKGQCEALRQKKDCLYQLGMNMREELKGSPTIMGKTNQENRNERLKALTASEPYVDFID